MIFNVLRYCFHEQLDDFTSCYHLVPEFFDTCYISSVIFVTTPGDFHEFPGCVECSSSGTPNTLGRLHFSMELTESRQAPADDEAEDASPELSSYAHGFHDMGVPVIIFNEF